MRHKLVLSEDDHVGPAHNISITGPTGLGFQNLEVSDDDEAAVLLPDGVDLATVKVKCLTCGVVFMRGEDFEFEEVEAWRS